MDFSSLQLDAKQFVIKHNTYPAILHNLNRFYVMFYPI